MLDLFLSLALQLPVAQDIQSMCIEVDEVQLLGVEDFTGVFFTSGNCSTRKTKNSNAVIGDYHGKDKNGASMSPSAVWIKESGTYLLTWEPFLENASLFDYLDTSPCEILSEVRMKCFLNSGFYQTSSNEDGLQAGQVWFFGKVVPEAADKGWQLSLEDVE